MSFGVYGIEWWAMVLALGAIVWAVWRTWRYLRWRQRMTRLSDLFSREPVWDTDHACPTCGEADPYRCECERARWDWEAHELDEVWPPCSREVA